MSEQYIGELRIFSFGFAPNGWQPCNGQLLPINQYQALFSILGTTYGGDGRTNFNLPNLQGRVPIHPGGAVGAALGTSGGEVAHTLLGPEMPSHTHAIQTAAAATTNTPAGGFQAAQAALLYLPAPPAPNSLMNPGSIVAAGGNQPHPNMAPYTVLNICIAMTGIYPSRN